MIGLRISNDVLNGTIQLFDNSNLSGSFSRAIIEIPVLGLSKELNAGSDPALSVFLSPNSLGIVLPAKVDKVLTIRYSLLSQIDPTGLNYTLGDNLVKKPGIFNLFAGTDYIYINGLYKIDKVQSSADELFLITPILENSSVAYVTYTTEICYTVLYDIPQKLKKLSFSFNGQCQDCVERKQLSEAFIYLEALKIQIDCNDCFNQNALLKRIKTLLDIC